MVIPETVNRMEYAIFRGCTNLAKVTIPNKITTIELGTFDGCTNLTNIIIPESVTTIGYNAFIETGLTKVDIPKTVTSMQVTSFPEGITLCGYEGSYAEKYATDNNFKFVKKYVVTFKDIDGTILKEQILYEGEKVIPPENPSKEEYDFLGWDKDFSNITSNLEINATYGHTVTFKDYDGTILKQENVFPNGASATAPENPVREGYTFLGWDKSFSNVTSNLEVRAQYGYTVIFKDYDGTILRQQKVTIGGNAIPPPEPTREASTSDMIVYKFVRWDKDYTNVTSNLVVTAQYEGSVISNEWVYIISPEGELSTEFYMGTDTMVMMPLGISGYILKAVGNATFAGNTNIRKVNITDTITRIGDMAFTGSKVEQVIFPYNLQEIGEFAFDVCFGIENITLPSSVTLIKQAAFRGCKNLKNINLQDTSIEVVNNELFKACTSLENIMLPNTVITIEDKAFAKCEKLRSVIIPRTTTKISTNAFDEVDRNTLILYGYDGSYAQSYATENGIKFMAIEEPTTKVNKNGIEFYEIRNEKQLAYISQMAGEWLNRNYILVNDIKLNDVKIEYNKETGELITNSNLLKQWKPIGTNGEVYTGIFDGNNHKISGVYINDITPIGAMVEGIPGTGLFGTSTGIIKNLKVENSYIRAIVSVGGIVGFNDTSESSKILNCSFSGAVVGSYKVAGIVGSTWEDVENCTNNGNIYGTIYNDFGDSFTTSGDFVGGLIGESWKTIKMSNLVNKGNVIARGNSIGGIIGGTYYGGEITNSYNLGNVSGNDEVAGICGWFTGEISDSYNKGKISGNERIGGITGSIGAGEGSLGIFDSYNNGEINGTNYAGGIVGANNAIVSKCYNTGNIKAKTNVGGIAGANFEVLDIEGWSYTNIEKCYNIGNVEGRARNGAVVGLNKYQKNISVQGCYYLKDSTINVNNGINGINNNEDKENVVEAKLKEFFPIYLDKNADASYEKLGYKKKPENPKPEVELPFTDVKKTDWYYNSVKYVYNNKIILGTTPTLFKPNNKLTRAQLVTILWRMEGSKKATGNKEFPDVKSTDYYYDAVKWAVTNRVANGYSTGKFGPNDNVTREQLAVMLYNYAVYKNKKISNLEDISKYKDAKGVASYSINAVKWAIGNKIISGKDNGTRIDPKGNATRAEASAMIQNYCIHIK